MIVPSTDIPVTVPAPRARVYTTKAGDTLRSIALTFFGNPLMARQIAVWNGVRADSPLSPGTELRID